MVKKTEGAETPEVATPEVETPEVETPTAEEQIATLQQEKETLEKERAALTKERDEKDKGLKTAHARLTEKDKEIRSKNAVNTRIDGLEETIRILAGMQDEKLGELEDGKRTDYLGKFDDIVKRQKADRDQEIAKTQQEEDYKHRDELWSRAKEFGTYEDNDNVAEIYDALMEGKIYKAERIIKKLEKPTDTKKEDKVESEEERINKLVEEKLRVKMEEKGMLESETGGPSGGTVPDEKWLNEVYPHLNDAASHERAKKILEKMK